MIIEITVSEDTPVVIVTDDDGGLLDTESFDNPHSAYAYAASVLLSDETR